MSAQEKLVELAIARPDNSAADLASASLAAAESRAVVTPADYQDAALELQDIKTKWRRIDGQRKELLEPVDEQRKRVMDFFRAPLDYLARAEAIIKRKLTDYQAEQERIRREEQRKVEAAAQRERDRIAEQARETERKAREKADADRKAAAAAEAEGRAAEAAKLNARAAATEHRGTDKAVALEQKAASVVAPVIQREAPKVAGIAARDKWCFEITDPSKINDAFRCPDEKKIGSVVRSLKGDARSVIGEGVRVWREDSIAARGSS